MLTFKMVQIKEKKSARRAVNCKSRGEVSENLIPADTLILDFQKPEMRENKFLLFKPLSLWHLVMAASAN